MSNDSNYGYLEGRLSDGLLLAADAAIGMGVGDRRESDAALHSRFIVGVRQAEGAARQIAHARGVKGQGLGWIKLAGRLGRMVEASTKSVELTIANALTGDPKAGRGPLWVRFGEILKMIAADCSTATKRKSADALIIGGIEYRN